MMSMKIRSNGAVPQFRSTGVRILILRPSSITTEIQRIESNSVPSTIHKKYRPRSAAYLRKTGLSKLKQFEWANEMDKDDKRTKIFGQILE